MRSQFISGALQSANRKTVYLINFFSIAGLGFRFIGDIKRRFLNIEIH